MLFHLPLFDTATCVVKFLFTITLYSLYAYLWSAKKSGESLRQRFISTESIVNESNLAEIIFLAEDYTAA